MNPRFGHGARRDFRRAPWRLAILLGLIVVGGLLAALPAQAHAVLVGSTPEDGSTLSATPAQVRLTFDESVRLVPGVDRVISTSGLRADVGDAQLADGGTTVVMALRANLPDGVYSASYRVVSADSHVVSGSITFGIGVDPAGVASSPAAGSSVDGLQIADTAAQALTYLGLVLLVGTGLACAVLWRWAFDRPVLRGLAVTGAVLIAAAAVVELAVQGPLALDAGWAGVLRWDGLATTVATRDGVVVLARPALLLPAAWLLTRPGWRRLAAGRIPRLVGAIVTLGLILTIVLVGHESVGDQVVLAASAATVHLAAMAIWLGGLLSLLVVVLPAAAADRPARLGEWSVIAFGCVAALVLTGEYQASRQVSPIQGLWTTGYGFWLLVKVALVALMLIGAMVSQRVVAGPATRPERSRRLRLSVAVEASLAVAVLAVTSVLVSQPPARTTYGPPVTVTAPLGSDHLQIQVDPTTRGPQSIAVAVLDQGGRPVPTMSMTATLSSADVPSLAVKLVPDAADTSRWVSSGAVAPLAGWWTLQITVDLDKANAYATSVTYLVW